MTDKELQEWEEEAKEADKDIKKIIIGLTLIVLGFILAKIEQITKAAEYSSY